ncbi:hypothetical protein CAPTEDRAFT_163062 [Capitella teleta]|uniref:Phosphorylase b kinase regulatory subunit n=1 Tax=Capitella teleta TaxID=283909 RepID=R7T8L0_CAPTE|nr:hypothetical protein CAPTEDRAFT_163062 [Capitella teleta]|eukprot:ELT89975.1 hypothetical protein CAPTEDRAFT_163062 [Capitella teleta]
MRNRSNSGVRLDFYQRMVTKVILRHQNPVTGLIPATPEHQHAWVRDNVYSILAVWGLSLAYRKNADLDEDRAKAYELEQSVVKLMRGLLFSMMKQCEKVERFKYTQTPRDALHAKYSVTTGKTVVGDSEWGHLQVDATSLYLLILAQMTASGLQIIYNLDEVAFIQNLVFYIQAAYRTPDYGIWERGDKTNHGLPELNATSIGMAKAALEALNELDLFGARGGPSSVIHVMPDEAQQCQAILHSVLPRESNSKETDAGLLSIISFPAFAVDDPELIELTRETVISKLQGRYGLCRFLRDGYRTPKEDSNRLHYEPWELQVFENIECEWPMFYSYLILDGIFNGDNQQVEEYSDALDDIIIKRDDGIKVIPELYAVPHDRVEAEYTEPKSQDRIPIGKLPQMWGQSLYVLSRLLKEGFLSPGELDPLNRRLTAEPKPDIVVQIVILAEDKSIQEKLAQYDLRVQTIEEVSPIQVYPARVLSHLFSHLGKSAKMGFTGRPADVAGILATSKLYNLGDQTLAFFPQFLDQESFYLSLDHAFLNNLVVTDIAFFRSQWDRSLGRPTFIIPVSRWNLDFQQTLHPALVATIKKLQTGYINGTRVHLGSLSDFVSTSCVTNLTFLTEADDSPDLTKLLKYIQRIGSSRVKSTRYLSGQDGMRRRSISRKRRPSVKGIIRRTCSIQIDPAELPGISSPTSMPTSPKPSFLNVTPSFNHDHHHLKDSEHPQNKIMSMHDVKYEGIDCEELMEQLKDSDQLHEQADIIHYLFITKGPDWETQMEDRQGVKVRDLLYELYDKAGHLKQWWLVRHTAGMLRKKVEDLAKAATDILVRQKQLAVGLPPEPREKIITRPLPPDELAATIHEACGADNSTAMLTQEILVYLAMFIRTEPKLFREMLRLRVGLIIQVMASELASTLKCTGEEASDQLLNLSPYEMKTLLHHILSGKEFGVTSAPSSNAGSTRRLSITSTIEDDIPPSRFSHRSSRIPSRGLDQFRQDIKTVDELNTLPLDASAADQLQDSMDTDRQGQWLRRRRLDGSLNRVPVDFYPQIWRVLGRCHGLSIEGSILPQSLTREMTPGELKFALQVEMVLNRIPQPEYRQLMVEGLMILCLIVENDNGHSRWEHTISVDGLVKRANEIFLEEQSELDGDVTVCCGSNEARGNTLKCGGIAGICQFFFDTAPSGRYGTMSYLGKAALSSLRFPTTDEGNLDCVVQ